MKTYFSIRLIKIGKHKVLDQFHSHFLDFLGYLEKDVTQNSNVVTIRQMHCLLNVFPMPIFVCNHFTKTKEYCGAEFDLT